MADLMKEWARMCRVDSLSPVADCMMGATIPELVDAFEKVADDTGENVEAVARDAYFLLVRYGAYEDAKRVKEYFNQP